MVRTQIQLTEYQAEELKKLAVQKNTSMSELIRRAVDSALAEGLVRDRKEILKRAIDAIGEFHSGKSDVSTRHDDYLAEAFSE